MLAQPVVLPIRTKTERSAFSGELIIFDCPDLLDRAFCERLTFDKISVCQLYDLSLVFQKVKTDLAPVAVVVCPIGVDCGGVFLLCFSCEISRNCKT